MSIPHPSNFCGGAFQDWLEVMLTPDCNGRCSWCVDRTGWHPPGRASWQELASQIVRSGRKNIILLGGEPTLYPDLGPLCVRLFRRHGLNVYITTNGSNLSPEFVVPNLLVGLAGVNISIHATSVGENEAITGIQLSPAHLVRAIRALRALPLRASVRLNCNLIKGYVDCERRVRDYIAFAGFIGADSVRFAELKGDSEQFVNAATIMGLQYGLNDDPFTFGCNKDCVIDGMPVNFRQMCGLQTPLRPKPLNPVQHSKLVLYYDGLFYPGWQQAQEIDVDKQALNWILDDLKAGRIDKTLAGERIEALKTAEAAPKGAEDPTKMHEATKSTQGCCY